MEVSTDLVRGCLLYDFKVGLSAVVSSRRICQAFGDSAVNERTARLWFKKFKSGDLSLRDEPRSGRPQVLNDGVLKAAIEEDSSLTCGEVARQFNVSDETVSLHLHRLDRLFTHARLCFVSGGQVVKWFIMSYYQRAKRSLETYTRRN
ncbi:histone-lysine N-methyltransferase SETMAR-like [Oratosquilla oratoria]|uniref:histone-lysine N-methyltransferase SETMAR-like n=1 Tax=Oratosquilla oratoria TaxID=337810 RepID=UPI003F77192E